VNVTLSTINSRPSGATTIPTAPFTSAGCASRARPENCLATAGAPRTSLDAPEGMAALSARNTTSGSSAASSASKSPPREAARKASTTSRWRVRSASGTVATPCTRRRARLASCLAAPGERPTTAASSSNGTANMSCSTNATRSAGASVSSTTSSARPTESASSASCSGSIPSSRLPIGSGTCASRDSSRCNLRERSTSRHTRATTVVSHPPRFSTALVSERLRRSQDSCTASSASLSEPSIR